MLANRLEKLQKSEEKYRTIFERSRDAIILTDPDGKIKEINQSGVQILGYKTQKEVLALESAASASVLTAHRLTFVYQNSHRVQPR